MLKREFLVQFVTLGISTKAEAELNKKYFQIKKRDLPVLILGTFHKDNYPTNRFPDPNDEGYMEKYIYNKNVRYLSEDEI